MSTEIRTDRQPQNITPLVSTIDAVETSKITLNALEDSSFGRFPVKYDCADTISFTLDFRESEWE